MDADSIIDADDDLIGFREEVDVDVARFEQLLRTRPSRTEEAVSVYQGDLASTQSQDCFVRERDRLANLYEDALADVAQHRLASAELEGAIDAAQALLSRDPLREEAHATLIEVYGRIGSRSQVVRQYRQLRAILAKELDVAPLAETDAAYDAALHTTARRSLAIAARGGITINRQPSDSWN